MVYRGEFLLNSPLWPVANTPVSHSHPIIPLSFGDLDFLVPTGMRAFLVS